MNLKELRIGNWINKDYYDTWEKDDYEYYWKEGGSNDAVEPIPLTPEILEKCGFEKIAADQYVCFQYQSEHHLYFLVYLRNGKIVQGGDMEVEREIKYVHQLQNLYFALTGEELEVML